MKKDFSTSVFLHYRYVEKLGLVFLVGSDFVIRDYIFKIINKIEKIIFIVVLNLASSISAQDYLDDDKKFMKITEISQDSIYGYKIDSPVKVGSEQSAIASYLTSLKVPTGDKLELIDMNFNYKDKKGLIKIVLLLEQERTRSTIFILTSIFSTTKSYKRISV